MIRLIAILFTFAICFPFPSANAAQPADCSQFDVWIWAQTVLESDPSTAPALDPDGNGLACEHLPFVGFAPMIGVTTRPKNIFPVSGLKISNADTLTVKWERSPKTILLHESEPLLTPSKASACGASQALDFMKWVLGWVDPNAIYVEPNYGTMADYDEHQGYLWMEIAGDWYMLNEVMIRAGWARYSDDGYHHLHKQELQDAVAFASDHLLGANLTCGGLDMPRNSQPTGDQISHAQTVQPNHGQFGDTVSYYDAYLVQHGPYVEHASTRPHITSNTNSSETGTNEFTSNRVTETTGVAALQDTTYSAPAEQAVYEAPVEQPVYEAPAVQAVYEAPVEQPVFQEPVVEQPATTGCHPAYGVCLPIVGDLNCGDIADKGFWADASDPYGLDRDGDGIACES